MAFIKPIEKDAFGVSHPDAYWANTSTIDLQSNRFEIRFSAWSSRAARDAGALPLQVQWCVSVPMATARDIVFSADPLAACEEFALQRLDVPVSIGEYADGSPRFEMRSFFHGCERV
jgi:hypothetical protein